MTRGGSPARASTRPPAGVPIVMVTVVGLGRTGLPLAVQYAEHGHRVYGADIDPEVVDRVNRSVAQFPSEAQLVDKLAAAVGTGRLTATTDTSAAVAGSDAVIVVLPHTVDADGLPDFRALDAATVAIGRGLHPDTLVSYQPALPVGTTRERWKLLLEQISGLREGTDFSVLEEADLHPLLQAAPPATGADRTKVRGFLTGAAYPGSAAGSRASCRSAGPRRARPSWPCPRRRCSAHPVTGRTAPPAPARRRCRPGRAGGRGRSGVAPSASARHRR